MWEYTLFFLIRILLSVQILSVGTMQVNSIIVSNYDRLCWSIKPKVIKEISLNLLKTMLKLLVKVHMFSFARDNKEKDKVKNKKIK